MGGFATQIIFMCLLFEPRTLLSWRVWKSTACRPSMCTSGINVPSQSSQLSASSVTLKMFFTSHRIRNSESSQVFPERSRQLARVGQATPVTANSAKSMYSSKTKFTTASNHHWCFLWSPAQIFLWRPMCSLPAEVMPCVFCLSCHPARRTSMLGVHVLV